MSCSPIKKTYSKTLNAIKRELEYFGRVRVRVCVMLLKCAHTGYHMATQNENRGVFVFVLFILAIKSRKD